MNIRIWNRMNCGAMLCIVTVVVLQLVICVFTCLSVMLVLCVVASSLNSHVVSIDFNGQSIHNTCYSTSFIALHHLLLIQICIMSFFFLSYISLISLLFFLLLLFPFIHQDEDGTNLCAIEKLKKRSKGLILNATAILLLLSIFLLSQFQVPIKSHYSCYSSIMILSIISSLMFCFFPASFCINFTTFSHS